MSKAYTKIPETTFKNIQLNAGILLDAFTPSTATMGNIIGATSGGVNFTATPSYTDFGEDIDNAPRNTKELKQLDDWEILCSGSFITVDVNSGKMLIGPADIDAVDETKIVPRRTLEDSDFNDLWWVGDYSDKNTGESAGFIAIHMMNALNTGGFSIQSNDRGKGEFAFEFAAHYSLENQEEVPFEVYIKEGEAETETTPPPAETPGETTNTETTTTP